MKNALYARNNVIKSNEKVKQLLELFKNQSDTFSLKNHISEKYLDSPFPEFEEVLRVSSSNNVYHPASAAMSLVLRAGLETKIKIDFDLIKTSVAKLEKNKKK